ncbi:MAG: ABC transporter ATP-binding protein [Bacillota bacterium]|nr:ABC transporter ATP-binding protein [Bacillota bacterium]
MSLLEVESLCAGYGDLTIVWDVSLKVEEGEIAVLLGGNGAGKTTLIESIVGINPPQKGSIRFKGEEIQRRGVHRMAELGITLVPQGRGLFGSMSVLENLYLGSYAPIPRAKRAESLEYVYSLFPILRERKTQKAGSLSGGEQQMLAIGRAIMSDPQLLILDEPSLGLAPRLVETVFRSIVEIRRQKKIGVLLVEQNLRQALSVADRGYVLESGRMVLEGRPEDLEANEHVKRAYLGC